MIPWMKKALGIDIGGTSIKAAFVLENGTMVDPFSLPIDKSLDQKGMLNALLSVAEGKLKAHPDCVGVGIGCPGAINPKKGSCDYSNNLGWKNFPVSDLVEKGLGLPCSIDNDANAALLGEVYFGVGKSYRNIVFLTLGTGVGSGLFINGEIYSGNEGKGAELGHTILELNGRLCTCGRRGCLEAYASASALCRDGAKAMKEHPESILWSLCKNPDEMNAKYLFDAERMGDETSKKVLDAYFYYLGEGCLNFINAFRPEALILGGGLAKQGPTFAKRLDDYLRQRGYGFGGTISPKVDVLVSSLGSDAGIYGAAALALEKAGKKSN